jgi:hypothetical protein
VGIGFDPTIQQDPSIHEAIGRVIVVDFLHLEEAVCVVHIGLGKSFDAAQYHCLRSQFSFESETSVDQLIGPKRLLFRNSTQ